METAVAKNLAYFESHMMSISLKSQFLSVLAAFHTDINRY